MNLQSDNIYVVLFSFWLTIEEVRFARFNVGTTRGGSMQEEEVKRFLQQKQMKCDLREKCGKREKPFSCATLEQ